MRPVLGIDPGKTGALCILDGDHLTVEDMPILKVRGKSVIDHYALARIIDVWSPLNPVVWIEYVSASPQMGVTSSFSFGMSTGILMGVCAAHFMPIEAVTPPVWKLAMKAKGDKDESRARAKALFPRQSELFNRVKDHGRADAALIALYGARHAVQEGRAA